MLQVRRNKIRELESVITNLSNELALVKKELAVMTCPYQIGDRLQVIRPRTGIEITAEVADVNYPSHYVTEYDWELAVRAIKTDGNISKIREYVTAEYIKEK